jgi:L-asparaginase
MFKLTTKALACAISLGMAGMAQASELPICKMLATGGTIAMKIDPISNAPVPAISGEDLLEATPEIAKYARIEVNNLSNIPSDYMDAPRWIELQKAATKALARKDVAGVIVSHGTDTLEETSYFLDLTIDSDKPVILTGAQRNASEQDFDGPRNLLNATRICVSEAAKGKGVMLALNNQINAAREVVKSHTSDVETFNSGMYGVLGHVDKDKVLFYRAPLGRTHIPLIDDSLERVAIVPMFGGADGALVKAAVANDAKGIVIQALGWGNVNIPMYDAIKVAIDKGVVVVISTRVPNGRVLPVYGFQGGGKTLKDLGAIFADNLPPHKARILLMLALQHTQSPKELQTYFDR